MMLRALYDPPDLPILSTGIGQVRETGRLYIDHIIGTHANGMHQTLVDHVPFPRLSEVIDCCQSLDSCVNQADDDDDAVSSSAEESMGRGYFSSQYL